MGTELERSDANDLPVQAGRYLIRKLVGQGAMGRVLLADDPVLERKVAVKVLRPDLKIPEGVRAKLLVRMRHEARAAARVAHPNLVTLYDMGEDDTLGLYLVFEYVEGPTLKQRIRSEPIPVEAVARLARELGAGLTCAHRAGIVHRDVKPDNIIVSPTGAKMADFGIARVPESTLTQAGARMGTPAYGAPESFKTGTFSPESDQFSLAASLYEALYSTRAFPGDDAAEVAHRIATDPPVKRAAARKLPVKVDEVLARAMSKAPAARFPSCEEFGLALSRALGVTTASFEAAGTPAFEAAVAELPQGGDRAPRMVAASTPTREPPPDERKWATTAIGALVVVVTLALLGWAATRTREGDAGDGDGAVRAGLKSAAPDGAASAAPGKRGATAAPAGAGTAAKPKAAVPAKATATPAATATPTATPTGAAAPSGDAPAPDDAPPP